MRLNVEMPLRDGAADPHVQATLARAFEAAGFASISLTDHPAPAAKWLQAGGHPTFDPFAGLSFLAAVTTSIRLMTNLVVLPYRNPFLTAKAVATVDRLSGGRFTMVAGTGYLRSEFAALGRPFDDRNDLFDEAIDVLQHAFSSEGSSRDGGDFSAREVLIEPGPVQRPHPPLWIGGNSARSRERVARLGNGWSPLITGEVSSRVTRTAEIRDLDDLARAIDDLHERVVTQGRYPEEIAVQVGSRITVEHGADHPDEALATLERLAAIGVTHAGIGAPAHAPLDVACETIARFGELVVARCG